MVQVWKILSFVTMTMMGINVQPKRRRIKATIDLKTVTPYHEPNVPAQKTKTDRSITIYNSWLPDAFPGLPVFLGRRSRRCQNMLKRLKNARKRTLVNVREHTTLGDGDVAEKLVQFLIVADGKL
jgi:hypothetical protein